EFVTYVSARHSIFRFAVRVEPMRSIATAGARGR
ncbi:MAG: hypothetical protein ACI89J_002390, partial [Hyphomicrobiaceae bacterium]